MKWAALFPGQGSQHPGMGQYLYQNFKVAKELFEEGSEALAEDMKELCFSDGSEDKLKLTENTQPALLLTSVCAYEVIKSETEIEFTASAGHSVGEYAAAVTGGVMKFTDAMQAVRTRGQAMQSAVPVGEGGMVAAMGLTPEQVNFLCDWGVQGAKEGVIEAANFNAPGQIVVSGSQKVINWMQENFSAEIFAEPPRRTRLIPLNVSAPFHCSLMQPAEEKMAQVLGEIEFRDANTPIVQNVDAQPHSLAEEVRQNLVRQVTASVRWVESIEKLRDLGCTRTLELGSGQVLSGLVKKIDKENLTTFNMSSIENLEKLKEAAKN